MKAKICFCFLYLFIFNHADLSYEDINNIKYYDYSVYNTDWLETNNFTNVHKGFKRIGPCTLCHKLSDLPIGIYKDKKQSMQRIY